MSAVVHTYSNKEISNRLNYPCGRRHFENCSMKSSDLGFLGQNISFLEKAHFTSKTKFVYSNLQMTQKMLTF